MTESPVNTPQGSSTHRVEALSDGIFAIVMTLLVFDIRLPEDAIHLPAALWELRFSLVGYFISFMLLGIYWLGHRLQFTYIKRADHSLHWLNIAFFACCAFVPFATSIVAAAPSDPLALNIYAGNLIVIGVVLTLHWWYATGQRRLVDAELSQAVVRFGTQRCMAAPCGYLIGAALAWLDPRYALGVFVLVPLLYITPGLQGYWLRVAGMWQR